MANIEFVHSSRGAVLVCINDFMFRKSRKCGVAEYYYCEQKNCKSTVQLRHDRVDITTLKDVHNHPNHKDEILRLKIIHNIRKRAADEPLLSRHEIFREEIQKVEATLGGDTVALLPTYASLSSTLYRDRSKAFVGFPRNPPPSTDPDSGRCPSSTVDVGNFAPNTNANEASGDKSLENIQFDDHTELHSEDSQSPEGDGQECYNCTSLCPQYNLTKFGQPLKLPSKYEGSNGLSVPRFGVNLSSEDPVTVKEALQRVYNITIPPTDPEPALCSYCSILLASIYKPFQEFRNLSIQYRSEMAPHLGARVKREPEETRTFDDSVADCSFENEYDDPLSVTTEDEPEASPLRRFNTRETPGTSTKSAKRDRPWPESLTFNKKLRRNGHSPGRSIPLRKKKWKCVYCLKRFSENFILYFHNKEAHPEEDDEGGLYPNEEEVQAPASQFTARTQMLLAPESPESPSADDASHEYHQVNSFPDNEAAAAALRADRMWQQRFGSAKFTEEGRRVYYDCKFSRRCPVKLYLLWDNASRTIKFYKTSKEHNHEVQEKGIPMATRAIIEQLYSDGVTKQTLLIKALREKGIPEPKMYQLGCFIRQLRVDLGIGHNVNVNDSEDEVETSAFAPIPAFQVSNNAYTSALNVML